MCRECFHGERYCSDGCWKTARRRQCREAQARYLAKKQGRKRRAAATAAYRVREGPRNGAGAPGKNSNRSRYRLETGFVAKELPQEALCADCGVRGRVKVWR